MNKHLPILIGLVIISVIGMIWIGCTLITAKMSYEANVTKNTILDNQTIDRHRNTPARVSTNKPGLPDNWSRKTPDKSPAIYEPSPEEKELYLKGIANLLPHTEKYIDNNPDFYANMNKKRAEASAYFENLIATYLHSTFYQHYYEIATLLRKMVEEDKNCKWEQFNVAGRFFTYDLDSAWLARKEMIQYDIYHLRYCLYAKDNERYELVLPKHNSGMVIYPNSAPIFHLSLNAESLINDPDMRAEKIDSLFNLLEDRRPIIAVDEDKIPARFYRYQDAAVEILQRMFIKAERPFPVEIPHGQYFSEYFERQNQEDRQKVINDIKAWVEEALNNPKESLNKK